MSESYQKELQEWMDEFESMTSTQIPRCVVPSVNGTIQLHTFTDASMSAIAVIVYKRTTNAAWIFHITICDQQKQKWHQSSRWTFQKKLEAATIVAELASRFLWERDDNDHKLKKFLNGHHRYTRMDPVKAETQDVHCKQIDQNSRKFQPGQLETHPWNYEYLKTVASTTGFSERTSRLLEFSRGQWSPHMRYTSDTTSDAGHWGWKFFNKESTTQLYWNGVPGKKTLQCRTPI